MLTLLAIKASGIPLHRWVDDIGDAGTVDTSPRRIQAPAYAGKNVAQSGLSDGPLAREGALQIARQQAASNAATAGCDVVTKNTTILAADDQNLRPTKGQEKCSKHRKAESMIANGATIPIVVETDFMLMVQ